MKQLLFVFLVILLDVMGCGLKLFASNQKESKVRYYRHEVNVGIGYSTVRTGWSDEYEKSVMDRFGLVVGMGGQDGVIMQSKGHPNLRQNTPYISYISLGYYYHLSHNWAVGGYAGYLKENDWLGYPKIYNDKEYQKRGYTDVKGTSLFMMPSVKWLWMNSRWCSLYSKASAGFHYQSLHLDSEILTNEETQEFKKSHMGFAYVITPIGWEIGKRNIRFLMEFGLGSNSNLRIGIVYRFGRIDQ